VTDKERKIISRFGGGVMSEIFGWALLKKSWD
jgi:hypothetical protein